MANFHKNFYNNFLSFYQTYEEYCIEVKRVGVVRLDKNLYKRLALPRTITLFKDLELVREITSKIQELLRK